MKTKSSDKMSNNKSTLTQTHSQIVNKNQKLTPPQTRQKKNLRLGTERRIQWPKSEFPQIEHPSFKNLLLLLFLIWEPWFAYIILSKFCQNLQPRPIQA